MSKNELEPEWEGDSNGTARWDAGYQLEGAESVTVIQGQANRAVAISAAEDVLMKTMEKVCEVGLKVTGEVWIVKREYRTQERIWPAEKGKAYETQTWFNKFSVTSKGAKMPEE